MAKKKVKKSVKAKKTSSKKGLKDSGIKTAREKMIGQHIGYRYDVNLLPDYKRLTPFLKKYIEHMPLYRQQQSWKRVGVKLPRNTMCNWLMTLAKECSPLYQLLRELKMFS